MDNLNKQYRFILMPALLPALVFMALSACRQPQAKASASDAAAWQQQRIAHYEAEVYQSAIDRIESGDLVTRLGGDITSELFRQMNEHDASFSHCGIASIENDTVFVYHAMGGEFNPDQTLLRQPLWVFGHASENKSMGIFRPKLNAAQKQQMLSWVQQQYARRTMFDMQFDFADDNRQYCAELVAKALMHASGSKDWLHFSSAGKLQYVAIDNLYRNPFVSEIIRYQY